MSMLQTGNSLEINGRMATDLKMNWKAGNHPRKLTRRKGTNAQAR